MYIYIYIFIYIYVYMYINIYVKNFDMTFYHSLVIFLPAFFNILCIAIHLLQVGIISNSIPF